MIEEDIIKFLKENIEPLNDSVYGAGYRASVYLTDGTYLPCVIFRNPGKLISLAMRRFKEEQGGLFSKPKTGVGYYNIVKNFVASGNCINYYDIAKVEVSRFALSHDILKQIKGETTMGWTGFVLQMKDRKSFSFGTTFRFAFFDFPKGYETSDIVNVINHAYVSDNGELKSYRGGGNFRTDINMDTVFRDKPYFECFIDGL
jgi:hypothetical protein